MSAPTIIPTLRGWGVECFTRSEWGSPREADGSYARRRSTHPMPAGPAAYHYLHITVTRDSDTVREGKAGARQIEGYGYSTPPMVSYQDLVTNEGRYFQGQDYGTKGTHTVNDKRVPGFPRDLNLVGYACALMQNVGDEVTDIQVDVVARVFAARELAGLVKRGAPIYPHRKFAAKGCPGDKAVARLDEIRRLKDHYVRTAQQEDAMPTRLRRAIYHESDPYALGNSLSGDLIAANRGLWADRDLQCSIEGYFIVTHWAKPSREGFRVPGKRVPVRPFALIRWASIAKLRTRDGYGIRTAAQAIRDAKRLGVPGVEFELKFLPTQAAMKRLAAAARKDWGADWQDHVQIKILTGFRWRRALIRAKRAGFTTTLIRYAGNPADLPSYVDHYRR
ncbi:MAG TPA: hypothetical protein VLI04_01585 [Nocardioidaceae bacterium]|nr:hypothetical protein [Nocardioidaceae bacterium]